MSDARARDRPEAADAGAARAVAFARRAAARFVRRGAFPWQYTVDLTLESLLVLADATGDDRFALPVREVLRQRRLTPTTVVPWRSQPFCSITFEAFVREGGRSFAAPYVEQSNRLRLEIGRSFDGAITHFGDPRMGRILIDGLQEYAARMARAGRLSGDETFCDECAAQYRIFRDALRNRRSGLWGHARGWYHDRHFVTPWAWGRGQGWVLRGLVEAMAWLPRDSRAFRELGGMLEDFATALLRFQEPSGFWRQVVDGPESWEETSGTALIAAYLSRARRHGFLAGPAFAAAARRAREALASRVSPEGAVSGGCEGTGPQTSLAAYLARRAPLDDLHAVAAVIFAGAGAALESGRGRLPCPNDQPGSHEP
jgi:rhamnogalacturonyl hydrolase YesR